MKILIKLSLILSIIISTSYARADNIKNHSGEQVVQALFFPLFLISAISEKGEEKKDNKKEEILVQEKIEKSPIKRSPAMVEHSKEEK